MTDQALSAQSASEIDTLVRRALSSPSKNRPLTRVIVDKVTSLKATYGLTHVVFVHKNEVSYASLLLTSDLVRRTNLIGVACVYIAGIKLNRGFKNLDRIVSNNCKLTYECVWYQSDNGGPWMCMFAINIYDWKDLGSTPHHPSRGCAGFYSLSSGLRPATATIGTASTLVVPNIDPLDSFGA